MTKCLAEITFKETEKSFPRTYLLGEDNFIYNPVGIEQHLHPFKTELHEKQRLSTNLKDTERIMYHGKVEYFDGTIEVGKSYYENKT